MKIVFHLAEALIAVWTLTSNTSLAETVLNGAGATFPALVYSKWIDEYHKLHPDIQVNYQAIGSGGGIRQFLEGTVDFGASDGPLNDSQMATYKDGRGFEALHFPTVLGADVPVYNLPGISEELNFTPEVLAGIFLGKITKWNDPELVKANPKVSLPSADIMVVHRSDGSGTTYIWTDYLSKINEEWSRRVGKGTSVAWPVGLSARGNDGVSALIEKTSHSLSYVELSYAIRNRLAYGRVRNSSGTWMKADVSTISAAASEAAKTMPKGFRVSIVDPPGKDAYPISSFTWLRIPAKVSDSRKREAMVGLLKWILTDGQTQAAALSYAPLPKEVVQRELSMISNVQ
jgi:phosphate transport system substrate-binding protein